MHLTDIQQTIYDRIGLADVPPSTVVRRILGRINQGQREILGRKGFGKLRERTIPVTVTASTYFATLAHACAQVRGIVDRTNQMPLVERSIDWVRQQDPAYLTLGNPRVYTVYDLSSPVTIDPSAAAALYTVSSAAGDNTQTVYLEGVTSGGYRRSASVALNGTTPANIAAAITDWVQVLKFYLSATAVGYVTLTQGSGGTELARIEVGRTFSRYSRVQLFPIPTANGTLYADVLLAINDMANAQDEPYLHEDFHWLLVEYAIMGEYEKREKPIGFSEVRARYRAGISGLNAFINSGGDGSDIQPRLSQLGPWYPPNS